MTDWSSGTIYDSSLQFGWTGVTYGNNLFVSVGQFRTMISSDGINWNAKLLESGTYGWSSVVYANGKYVAVGGGNDNLQAMVSSNGIDWEIQNTPSGRWTSLIYGNNLFVAVRVPINLSDSGYCVMTSPDGITWTRRATPVDAAYYSVSYGNGVFVAISRYDVLYSPVPYLYGATMTSVDGITWVQGETVVNNRWFSVTFGNNLFVAVSESSTNNLTMTSEDGKTWSYSNGINGYWWKSVCFGNGLFVAIASINNTTDIQRVMTSPDGKNWTSRKAASANNWLAVTYANSLFIGVGGDNSVMYGVDNSCYLKGSLILTSNNTYVPIEDLKKGDLIKTYKHGDIKIHGVGKKMFCNVKTTILFSLYHNKKTNLTITGGHSLLVDSITKEQEEKQLDFLFNEKIEDKYCLLSCFSEDFELIEPDNKEMEIYHLCLESEDVNTHYGIWANDTLTESCPISRFINKNFQ
jgi:hypothetical protein